MSTTTITTPLQHLASLTALVRALDALLHPADLDKLASAAQVAGSLPWLHLPKSAAPAYDSLRAAIAEVAASATLPVPNGNEFVLRLQHAVQNMDGDGPRIVSILAAHLKSELDLALQAMVDAAPKAAPGAE